MADLREREKVNVAFFSDVQYPNPSTASCKWCNEVLIPIPDDSTKLLCQGCGIKYPSSSASPNQGKEAHDSNSKETKSSKLKQIDSLENRPLVLSINDDQRKDRQRRSGFDETEEAEHLSALNIISRLYGNAGDY